MKHNKCNHCFRRWMPVVWVDSSGRQLCRNILLRHFRMTTTIFEMLCNEINPLVSKITFFDAHVFPSPTIRINSFLHKSKTTSSDLKINFCELRWFPPKNVMFPSLVSDAILQNAHKNKVMETARFSVLYVFSVFQCFYNTNNNYWLHLYSAFLLFSKHSKRSTLSGLVSSANTSLSCSVSVIL